MGPPPVGAVSDRDPPQRRFIFDREPPKMSTHQQTLDTLQHSLDACRRSQLRATELAAQWRAQATPLPLPPAFSEVLQGLLDRLEASGLFSEESCSFSQSGLLDNLQQWLDQARRRLV